MPGCPSQRSHFQPGVVRQGELTAPGCDRPRLLNGIGSIRQAVLNDIRRFRKCGQGDQLEVKPRQDSLDLDELPLILRPDYESEGQGDAPQ